MHDAIQHDGPALELAELVNDEVGPALVTVLFTDGGSFGDAANQTQQNFADQGSSQRSSGSAF